MLCIMFEALGALGKFKMTNRLVELRSLIAWFNLTAIVVFVMIRRFGFQDSAMKVKFKLFSNGGVFGGDVFCSWGTGASKFSFDVSSSSSTSCCLIISKILLSCPFLLLPPTSGDDGDGGGKTSNDESLLLEIMRPTHETVDVFKCGWILRLEARFMDAMRNSSAVDSLRLRSASS
uniref:Uncharacterized protein n=1 Tax=Romanomermis culicivorax TaxID=13658 RepID=A0A915J4I1_ROMCU